MSKMYVVGYIQLYLNTFAGKQWHNAQICNILFCKIASDGSGPTLLLSTAI